MKGGEVQCAPMIACSNLVKLVHHYLDKYDKFSLLTWHNNPLPVDEILVKIGGDHGGNAFKMSFQVANLENPNSTKNTIPFWVFNAKDTPANLATVLSPFASHIKSGRGGRYG